MHKEKEGRAEKGNESKRKTESSHLGLLETKMVVVLASWGHRYQIYRCSGKTEIQVRV